MAAPSGGPAAETLRQAAALMRTRAEQCRIARDETSPEVHGGPDAHWSSTFLASAILGHPHVISDDPEVVRVVHAGADSLAPWHPVVTLAVADWLDQIAHDQELLDSGVAYSRSIFWDAAKHRALAVARAYLGGPDA